VVDADDVSAAGLQQLAALEQLTSLGFHTYCCSNDVLEEHLSDRLPASHRRYGPSYDGIINKVCVSKYASEHVSKHKCVPHTVCG